MYDWIKAFHIIALICLDGGHALPAPPQGSVNVASRLRILDATTNAFPANDGRFDLLSRPQNYCAPPLWPLVVGPGPFEMPSAVEVRWSNCPLGSSPCCRWKAISAFRVRGPKTPSSSPTSKPFSFRAICACRTRSRPRFTCTTSRAAGGVLVRPRLALLLLQLSLFVGAGSAAPLRGPGAFSADLWFGPPVRSS